MSRRRAAISALVGALACLLAADPARAGFPKPRIALQAGRTFAVSSPTDGAYDQGGWLLNGSLLWGWEDRFRFGVTAFAADIGYQTEQIIQPGTDGEPPVDYGLAIQGHRSTFGGAWRTDLLGPALGKIGRSFATASYGYFRLRNDQTGEPQGAVSALGGSVGLGLEHAFTPRQWLGIVAAGTWMSNDYTPHYGSAALEYMWHW